MKINQILFIKKYIVLVKHKIISLNRMVIYIKTDKQQHIMDLVVINGVEYRVFKLKMILIMEYLIFLELCQHQIWIVILYIHIIHFIEVYKILVLNI